MGVVGHGVGGPSGGLLQTFTSDLTGSAMIALGLVILAVGAVLLFSSTDAGQVVGQGIQKGARTALAVIPQTRALSAL